MTTKEFKKRIMEQKRVDEKRRAEILRRELVIDNFDIVVKTNNIYVKTDELKDIIGDILSFSKGSTIKKNEVFKLSNVSDCIFDMKFLGKDKEMVLHFELV